MTDTTPRLALPYLDAGQAQKEMTHNEALARIDLLLTGTVEAVDATDPPATPLPGQVWLLGTAPTGVWVGQAGTLAGWTEGGWRFITATEGLRVRVKNTGLEAVYSNGSWQIGTVDAVQLRIGGNQVVGARQPAIADPVDGATVDVNARVTIGQILGVLRAHGLIATA
jgi:hypothetical protein